MIVPEDIRKCVAFIGYKMADGRHCCAGTAFFIAIPVEGVPEKANVFLVTAKHVISNIRGRGLDEIYIRLNLIDGTASWKKLLSNDWRFHPTDDTADVTVLSIALPDDWDHMALIPSTFLTESIVADYEIGLGEEVFITGLFNPHRGEYRNIPIVRVGNIAAMDEEKVIGKDGRQRDIYLVEARSIGGLSGSPVFVNLGLTRMIRGSLKTADKPVFYLFGLIHGHYDIQEEKVNMGIAMVTPFYKLIDTITMAIKEITVQPLIPSAS